MQAPSEDCVSVGLSYAKAMAVVGIPVGFFRAHETLKVCFLVKMWGTEERIQSGKLGSFSSVQPLFLRMGSHIERRVWIEQALQVDELVNAGLPESRACKSASE